MNIIRRRFLKLNLKSMEVSNGRDGNDIAVKNEDDLAVTVQTAGKSCIIFDGCNDGRVLQCLFKFLFHVNTPCKINLLLS